MAGMERFTQRARSVLSLAHQEAERSRNNVIGTEHLLIGLLYEVGGVAGRVLYDLGLTVEKVREVVKRLTNASADFYPDRVELGSKTQQALEFAVEEARQLEHHYIGTEHILLGLVRVDDIAMEVLRRLGITAEQVRGQTRRVLDENAAFRKSQAPESSFSKKTNQVLLVYGHDVDAAQAVASYVESLGLQIVKFSQHSGSQLDIFATEVAFAVGLLTADDLIVSKSEAQIAKFHASQNVIYELGFFRGKLGYKRVCALFKSDPEISVELPTESFRVLYIPFDSMGTWKSMLSKKMQEAGIMINSGNIE